MVYALLGVYLLIGLVLGALAVRRYRSSPVATILAWMTLWPVIFGVMRVQNPPPDMEWPYRPRHLATFFLVTGGLVALALAIARVFLLSLSRPLFTLLGLEIACCVWFRPYWFWNDPQMHDLRGLIGDRLTLATYLALAVVLIWLGLFTNVQLPSP